jgi:DNA-binding transcriptional MerR regulator
MNKQKIINERKNVFPASDWFDLNFLAGFLHSDLNIVKQFNQQTYTIGEEKLSSRVLNHWYQSGIITDDRLDNKGWKKFSFSEIVWISIVIKLRKFGLDLQRIKKVKEQIDYYNTKDSKSKCPLLDFYMLVAITSTIPIKFIVFESGQAEIVKQSDIDIANQLNLINEDFISIDINKLLDKALTKKKVKADYFNSIKTSNNPLFTQIEESLSKNNIQSVTIKTNDKDYLIDEVFFTKDGKEARAIKNMVKYGRLIENMTAGKSTYQIIKQKKIKKE